MSNDRCICCELKEHLVYLSDGRIYCLEHYWAMLDHFIARITRLYGRRVL